MPTIRGQIVDPEEKPVTEAAVYIVSAPINMPDIAQLVNSRGEFNLSAPVVGRYTIGIRSDIWGEIQKNIEIKDEDSLHIVVQFIHSEK